MAKSKKRKKTVEKTAPPAFPLPVTITYLVITGIHIIPVLTGSSLIWGTDQWRYFSASFVIAAAAAALIPVIPSVAVGMANTAKRMWDSPAGRFFSGSSTASYAVLCAAAVIVFLTFRQGTHFMGDGYLWARNMASGVLFNFKEPLASGMYQAVYNFLTGTLHLNLNVFDVAAGISIVSGAVFLVYAVKCALLLGKNGSERTLTLLMLLSAGTAALFFGYVEVYPPTAACITVYIYYGIRYIRGEVHAAVVLAAAAVCILLHLSAAAILPGAVLPLLMKRTGIPARKNFYGIIGGAAAAGILTLWVLQQGNMFSGFFSKYFLPVTPGLMTDRTPYFIFSWRHLVDFLNEILLIAPAAIVAGTAALAGKRSSPAGSRSIRLFLETTALFYILEFLVFNKELGVSRDWDIFSPAAIPLMLLAAAAVFDRTRNIAGRLAVIVFFIIAVHTSAWIAVNASAEKSVQRFANLIDDGWWTGFAKGYAYDELRAFAEGGGDQASALHYAAAAANTDPENVRYLYNAGVLYRRNNMVQQAENAFRKILAADPDYTDAYFNLSGIYLVRGDYRRAAEMTENAVRLQPDNAGLHGNLSVIYLRLNRTDDAIAAADKAVGLAPANAVFYNSRGLAYFQKGDFERAKQNFLKSVELDPASGESWHGLGQIHYARGEYSQAHEYYSNGIANTPERLDLWIMRSHSLRKLGRFDEALHDMLHAGERRKNDPEIMNNIAVLYMLKGEHDAAEDMLRRVIDIAPQYGLAHVNLAMIRYEDGRYAEAWNHVFLAEQSQAPPGDEFLNKLGAAMKRPRR